MYDVSSVLVKIILSIVIPILILLFVIAMIKTLFDYLKYGKKIFSSFQKKDISSAFNNILLMTLKEIKGNKLIIKPDNLESDYILIYSNGIVLLKSFNMQGNFKYKDNYLYYDVNKRIKSPINFKNDIEIVNSLISDIPIKTYLITPENTHIDGIEYITINKIIYELKNDGNIKELDKIKNILSKSV